MKLNALCSTTILGILLSVIGCKPSDRTSRWPVPKHLITPKNLSALTNSFFELGHPFTFRTFESSNYQFAVVCRFPHSGIRSFEVYCFETIGDDGWYFRNVEQLHFSDSMNVAVEKTTNGIVLSHDGFRLTEIRSIAEEYERKRKSRTNDPSRMIYPDTNVYIFPRE